MIFQRKFHMTCWDFNCRPWPDVCFCLLTLDLIWLNDSHEIKCFECFGSWRRLLLLWYNHLWCKLYIYIWYLWYNHVRISYATRWSKEHDLLPLRLTEFKKRSNKYIFIPYLLISLWPLRSYNSSYMNVLVKDFVELCRPVSI